MISTDKHIIGIWISIAAIVVGWFGYFLYQQSLISELRYNTGVELAKVNTALAQIQVTLVEIRKELREH